APPAWACVRRRTAPTSAAQSPPPPALPVAGTESTVPMPRTARPPARTRRGPPRRSRARARDPPGAGVPPPCRGSSPYGIGYRGSGIGDRGAAPAHVIDWLSSRVATSGCAGIERKVGVRGEPATVAAREGDRGTAGTRERGAVRVEAR